MENKKADGCLPHPPALINTIQFINRINNSFTKSEKHSFVGYLLP